MKISTCLCSLGCALLSLILAPTAAWSADREFRAGAFAQPISPTKFPAPVNGNMKGAFATSIHDPMHARCLALHDGKTEIVFCIVDACAIPRDVCDRTRELASQQTGIPADNILISATHTHSAAALTPLFQSAPDPDFVDALPERLAAGIARAHAQLEPAEIGWGQGSDPSQVFNRRWLVKPGEAYENPFGGKTDRARMNPGYQNPTVSRSFGRVDPAVAVLAVRSAADKRPLALFANYSLHYVGGWPAISADYFAAFAAEIGQRLHADDGRYANKPAFVGAMSNGTSGDINNVNFGGPPPGPRQPGEQIQVVARSVAEAALQAYGKIQFKSHVPLDVLAGELELEVRKPSADELQQARDLLEKTPKDSDGQYGSMPAIYARETVLLEAYPERVSVKLQVLRIGDLSVAAIPSEVFVDVGLDLKKRTPFAQHFTISLANGYNGYLPTAEHHQYGGYETWRARSSYLEVDAAAKITLRLIELLNALEKRKPQ
ncbi:MAG: neutral/alkaline non-lysosomal ceramidase N-terminal domain-containing protein [Planctomycetes bacterium]|nr:neutral/alkaline non-lysosomal ceramidase N-terminal domain-containing protein [Planctomycetota bacterium]